MQRHDLFIYENSACTKITFTHMKSNLKNTSHDYISKYNFPISMSTQIQPVTIIVC